MHQFLLCVMYKRVYFHHFHFSYQDLTIPFLQEIYIYYFIACNFWCYTQEIQWWIHSQDAYPYNFKVNMVNMQWICVSEALLLGLYTIDSLTYYPSFQWQNIVANVSRSPNTFSQSLASRKLYISLLSLDLLPTEIQMGYF
jgi:hypothetical protein